MKKNDKLKELKKVFKPHYYNKLIITQHNLHNAYYWGIETIWYVLCYAYKLTFLLLETSQPKFKICTCIIIKT